MSNIPVYVQLPDDPQSIVCVGRAAVSARMGQIADRLGIKFLIDGRVTIIEGQRQWRLVALELPKVDQNRQLLYDDIVDADAALTWLEQLAVSEDKRQDCARAREIRRCVDILMDALTQTRSI